MKVERKTMLKIAKNCWATPLFCDAGSGLFCVSYFFAALAKAYFVVVVVYPVDDIPYVVMVYV